MYDWGLWGIYVGNGDWWGFLQDGGMAMFSQCLGSHRRCIIRSMGNSYPCFSKHYWSFHYMSSVFLAWQKHKMEGRLSQSPLSPFQVFMLVQVLGWSTWRDLFGHGERTSVYNLLKVFVDIWMALVKYKWIKYIKDGRKLWWKTILMRLKLV